MRHFFLLLIFMMMGTALFIVARAPVSASTQPRVSHSACTTHCVMDENVLRSSMGDTQAKNAYHSWFDTFYRLTGCSDSAFKNIIEIMVDIAGDLTGGGGGTTMQCWQELLAQAASCSDLCSDYFVPNAKYGPNVRVILDGGVPGEMAVTLTNNDYGYLPEEKPNAYSLKFYVNTSLSLNGGTAMMIDQTFMTSLSYSNWITRGGMDDCISAYGADSERCQLLSGFNTPSETSLSVDFYDGAFYDISGYASTSGAAGSFSSDGYVILDSDEDSVSIQQGPYAGFAWTKIHNKSTGKHTSQISRWDASSGAVTINNNECNSWLCRLTDDQTDADTYVFALQGPPENRLPGQYTVRVEADVVHDKDYSNNTISYSYSEAEVGETFDDLVEAEDEEPVIPLSDLPIIDIPGPGISGPYTLPEDLPGLMFRLHLPEDVVFSYISLQSLDEGLFWYYGRRATIPVPEYPHIWNGTYSCLENTYYEDSNGCPIDVSVPFDYYIFVPSNNTGRQFQFETFWETRQEQEATQSYQQTQQALPTQEYLSQFNEVEPNDSYNTAILWDMVDPITGRLEWGNKDYVRIDIQTPGIYTFSVTEVSSNLRVKLYLTNGHNTLDSVIASDEGEPLSITFDASSGEQYFLVLEAKTMIDYEIPSAYQLELSGFIPDPYESNDDWNSAKFWDISQGPIQGYFWDQLHGAADYYKFIAPQTLEDTLVTFNISNPSPDLKICPSLMNQNGQTIKSFSCTALGEPASYSYTLVAGQEYCLKIRSYDRKTSDTPYTVSLDYQPAEEDMDDEDESGIPQRIKGHVTRMWGVIPTPISNVEIYIQVANQAPVLLDTTNFLGNFAETVYVEEGEEIRVWPVLQGTNFSPEENIFFSDIRDKSHRADFTAIGGEILQETPPPDLLTTTPLPPLIQTALATSAETPGSSTSDMSESTPLPPAGSQIITVYGTLWRLFNSGPAGVGQGEVILSINGVDQPSTLSMIDGTYQIMANVNPGDNLTLRAQAPEDNFEPILYSWVCETGVREWSYDFYSYWEEINMPDEMDQNHLFGRVVDANGQGIAGVYIYLMMGTSDALLRLGPTNDKGYYNEIISLPNRVMVKVWPDLDGAVPSSIQFFHAYFGENIELNFRLPSTQEEQPRNK